MFIQRVICPDEQIGHIKNLEENGYTVINSYISDSNLITEIENLKKLHERFFSSIEVINSSSPKGLQRIISNDQVVNNVFYFDKKYIHLATTGDHLRVISHFLNDPHYGLIPDSDSNFILSQLNARNGKVPLPYHVDVRLITPGLATWSMQCFLAINEINKKNGSLKVIPGSHLTERMPETSPCNKKEVTLNLNPGDLVIFYSKLHHATNAGGLEQDSWTILFTYRSWWCKQQFDISTMVDLNDEQLSKNQKLILGLNSRPSSDPFSSPSLRTGY